MVREPERASKRYCIECITFYENLLCAVRSNTRLLGGVQDVPVTSGSGVHILNRLLGLGKRTNLNPCLDVLGGGEIEHLLDVGRSSDQTASERNALSHESLPKH